MLHEARLDRRVGLQERAERRGRELLHAHECGPHGAASGVAGAGVAAGALGAAPSALPLTSAGAVKSGLAGGMFAIGASSPASRSLKPPLSVPPITASTRQSKRKSEAETLVSLVSTLPAPAPSAISSVPPPKARPEPDSFFGN